MVAVEGNAFREASLVDRLLVGDDLALQHLYDIHAPWVHALARRVTADNELAQEVTQDVFVHLWSHADRFEPTRGSLRSYLGVMTHRRAVDAVRRSQRQRAIEAKSEEHEPPAAYPDDPVSEGAHLGITAELLRKLLDGLPREQRDAVALAYFRGLSYREVARELDISEGTAKSRLRLALARLRKELQPQGVQAWV